jgi:hypothetical protein
VTGIVVTAIFAFKSQRLGVNFGVSIMRLKTPVSKTGKYGKVIMDIKQNDNAGISDNSPKNRGRSIMKKRRLQASVFGCYVV